MFTKAISHLDGDALLPTRLHKFFGLSTVRFFPPDIVFISCLSVEMMADRYGDVLRKEPGVYPVLKKVSELHNIEEARHILFTKLFLHKQTANAGFIKRCLYSYLIIMNIYFMRSLYVRKEIFERVGISNSGKLYRKANRNYKYKVGKTCLTDIKKFVSEINGFNWATRWAWRTFFKNRSMKQPASRIAAIAGYAPKRVVSNCEIERTINQQEMLLSCGSIERLFGIKERHYAADGEQASDLAVTAARKIISTVNSSSVDYLIFAAASSDLIEPATANIVQQKLGLTCMAFDVKNACNSFVTALHLANAFIVAGDYKKILIATGERLSQSVKFTLDDKEELIKRLAAYSLGDAGAAALVEPSVDERGIYKQKFLSFGQYWNLCTIPGGGSMFPHDSSKNYFEGKTMEMRNLFLEKKGAIAEDCLADTGWTLNDIDHFFMHHVSKNTFDLVAASLGISSAKFYNVIESHGNTAAASIPLL